MYDMMYPHIKMPETTISSVPINSSIHYILNPFSQRKVGEWYRDYFTCCQNECVPGKWNPDPMNTKQNTPILTEISICKFLAEESKQRILQMRYPGFKFHWGEHKQRLVDTRNT